MKYIVMKLKLTLLFVVLSFAILYFPSCDKEEKYYRAAATDGVDIYLLESYETGDKWGQISDFTLAKEPLVKYADLLKYDAENHTFKISANVIKTFEAQKDSLLGKPFAVVVDQKVVYTGSFVTAFFSSIWNCAVIYPYKVATEGQIEVQLGYPYLMDDMDIPDYRNDVRIIETFRKDSKLIE